MPLLRPATKDDAATIVALMDMASHGMAPALWAAITPAGKAQMLFAENHDVSRIASDPLITPTTSSATINGMTVIFKALNHRPPMRSATQRASRTDHDRDDSHCDQ